MPGRLGPARRAMKFEDESARHGPKNVGGRGVRAEADQRAGAVMGR